MLAVIGALEGELAAVVAALHAPTEEAVAGHLAVSGTIDAKPVVAVRTGVGKSLAAMVTQAVIERYRPAAILCAGIGGALSPNYHIGDLILGKDCVQYDVDARSFGFALGEIPETGMRIFDADTTLLERARRVRPADGGVAGSTGRLYVGRILTGDRFLGACDGALTRELTDELCGEVVDMESASVALVAAVHGIPFLAVRTISDIVVDGTRGKFRRVLRASAENALRVVRSVLE